MRAYLLITPHALSIIHDHEKQRHARLHIGVANRSYKLQIFFLLDLDCKNAIHAHMCPKETRSLLAALLA
jgi:hypothetical protein